MAIEIKKLVCGAIVVALGGSALGAPGAGGEPEQISAEDLLAELARLDAMGALITEPTANPSSFGVTGGFGLPRGAFAVSASYTDEGRSSGGNDDGSIGAALGLGDPYSAVGLDLSVGISSVGEGFGEDGTLGVRLHRVLPGFVAGGQSSVAVGVSNAGRWGTADSLDQNYYGSFSTILPMPSGVSSMVTVGYANNGELRNDGAAGAEGAFYGSLGIGWNEMVNTTAAWSGEEVIVSAGLKPFRDQNIIVTAGAGDVTDEIDNRRFLLTVAWFTQNIF